MLEIHNLYHCSQVIYEGICHSTFLAEHDHVTNQAHERKYCYPMLAYIKS
jgi:hypothetical protein